jgi:CubicO group peptidase (beta-lactamase class C family)
MACAAAPPHPRAQPTRQALAVAAAEPRSAACQQLAPLLAPLVEQRWVASASVAVVRNQHVELCSFGSASGDADATPDTLYEIGSLSKLLTGLLLAQMVGAGELTLDQPVSALVSTKIPQRERPISLLDLATHQSGLPRMPSNLQPRDAQNPYADYSSAQLFDFVATSEPGPAGTPSSYSNLGAALLGLSLAQRAGKPYGALVEERVLRPLGMSRTYLGVPSAEQRSRAQGHDADAEPRPAWDFDAFAPAGGWRSSARDMAKFLAAATQPSGVLAPALQLAEQPRATTKSGNQIGLFFQQRSDGSLWHNGQTGGFASYLGIDPTKRVGVCLLLSTAFEHADDLGDRLLALQRGEKAAPLALPGLGPLPPASELEAYGGQYWLSDEFSIRIFAEGGSLYAQATGQGALRLWPSQSDQFYFRSVDARLEFERADDRVVALYLVQNGARQRGARR